MKQHTKNTQCNHPRLPLSAVAAAVMVAFCQPAAAADSDIDVLKKELAAQKNQLDAQRQLIERLLQGQEAQKQVIAKVEKQTAAVPQSAPAKSGEILPGVTVYGTADVNVASVNSGFGSKTTFGTGGMIASRIGVKAERDIGNGWKAVGEAEAGLAFDYGTAGNAAAAQGINNAAPSSGGLLGTGAQIFSRQAYVGVSSTDLGKLTLGRQYAGSYIAAAANGYAMGVGLFGNGASLLPNIGGMPTRVNNSIVYQSPLIASSLSAYLTYTAGSENNVNTNTVSGATTVTDKSGQGWDLAMFYRQGPFGASLTTWNVNAASFVTAGETSLAKKTGAQVVANYDFGIMKVYGAYMTGTIGGGNYENVTKTLSKSSGWSLSAKVPLGKHTVYAAYSQLDDKSLLNKDANMVGLAYAYDLYTNTKLYASWGRLTNKGISTYSLLDGGDIVGNVTTPGYSPSGFMVGINNNF